MELVYVFFGLLGVVVPGAVLYLLVSHSRLKKKVSGLEAQVAALWGGPTATVADAEPGASDAAPIAAPPNQEPNQAPDQDAAPGPWSKPVDVAVATGSEGGASPDLVPDPVPDGVPRTFVFRRENLDMARQWLARNWFLAVAALSLALAGVFLVQYGVENGLLSPFWRVIAAAVFGAVLVGAGEVLRRKWGDGRDGHTAYLPSTFSGAGLVVLFAAVLAARQLYGLIGPEAALVWLVVVSALAVVLGWYYGPLLAVVGILGSLAAPFLVGGDSATAYLFFYYFALVAWVALAVDAIKHWAWVSALAVLGAFGAAYMIWSAGAGDEHFLAFALIVAAGSAALPVRRLWPRHDGPMALSQLRNLWRRAPAGVGFSDYPTRLAGGAFTGAVAAAMLVVWKDAGQGEVWLALASLSALFVAATLWFRRAPALDNLALLPPLALLWGLLVQWQDAGSLYLGFRAGLERLPETAPPLGVTIIAGAALIGSSLAFWRSLWGGARVQAWAGGAAVLASLVLGVFELLWQPAPVIGAYFWAGHGIVIAAVMVGFASAVARRDGADKRRVAYFALAAITMITFALIVILSSAALTVALAVMVLGAATVDRRLNLPLMGVFVQVGVIVIGWRLVLEPGMFWALTAAMWEVLLAYLGSAVLLGMAWIVLARRARLASQVTVESGIWAILGVLASVLLNRALSGDMESDYGVSLLASIWLMLMLVQLYRLRAGGVLRLLRIVLAVVYGLVAALGYLVIALFLNPLLPGGQPVVGPPVLDSLAAAYAVPALILAVGVWKLPDLNRWLRYGLVSLAALFAASYVGLEIRRFWQGNNLNVATTTDSELYSYTIAMLIVAVALLFIAFSRRSLLLRRIATIGIGLTIAKVFLIDMSGLAGLLRVVTFLGLGLSLSALAWIDRQMARKWTPEGRAN
jgi:uncharacterized membrane protein